MAGQSTAVAIAADIHVERVVVDSACAQSKTAVTRVAAAAS